MATDGLPGVTSIDTKVEFVTISVVEPLTLPDVAETVADPIVSAEARPVVETVATAVFADAQAAEVVRFCVVPSVKVPVAVNCCVRPFATRRIRWRHRDRRHHGRCHRQRGRRCSHYPTSR